MTNDQSVMISHWSFLINNRLLTLTFYFFLYQGKALILLFETQTNSDESRKVSLGYTLGFSSSTLWRS